MNTDKYKIRLEKEKNILEEELSSIGKLIGKNKDDWEASPEVEVYAQEVEDEASMSERGEDYEERSSKLRVLKSRLSDVDQALENIKNNTYGLCQKCNNQNKIEEDRLEANPAAKTCKTCMDK